MCDEVEVLIEGGTTKEFESSIKGGAEYEVRVE